MRMLCYKCNHPWNYKGTISGGRVYVTCPSCMRKVRVDRSLVEDSSGQRLLTSISKKDMKTTSSPLRLPTTTSFKIEFESIKDKQGLIYNVDKRIAQQFRNVLDEEETPVPGIEPGEEEPVIKIFNNLSDFNMEILDKGCQEEEPTIRILPPSFEVIRVIPRDPIKHLDY